MSTRQERQPAADRDKNSGEAAQAGLPGAAAPPLALRPRVWLFGLPLLLAVCVLSVYADMSAQVIQFGVLQFAPPAVAALFLMALANAVWKRLFRRPCLRPAEMLAIYAMLLVGVMISTRGLVEKIVGSIAYLAYAARGSSPDLAPFLRYIPRWMVPYDPAAARREMPAGVRGFYEGNHGHVPWAIWAGPLAADFALMACVLLVFLCMGTLLRRQWVDVEHLSFPLTSLPIALIRNESDGRPLLPNPLFWGGIGLACLIFGINGLHVNSPSLPQIALSYDLAPLLTSPPWNQITFLRAYLSLAVVGFAYFMPSDVLFSLWFFYLLLQVETVVAGGSGYTGRDSHAWSVYQSAGAYLVLAGAVFWQARAHLARVWQTAFRPMSRDALDDSGELMPYRTALLGLAAGFAGIIAWMTLAGMNPLLALAQMSVYVFIVVVVMSRAVAQAGLLMTETSFVPLDLLQVFAPASALGNANLTMTAVANNWFSRDLRGELLSPVMDTQRIAGGTGGVPRALLTPLLIAIPVSALAASAAYLHLHYTVGGMHLYYHPTVSAEREFDVVKGVMQGNTRTTGPVSPGALAVGVGVTLALVLLRERLPWFPLHPLGYALAPTWSLIVFWFGFLIAWIIRSLVLRYGGLKLYRAVSPFMLGLIVGEFLSAVFWSVLNMTLHVSAPEFPWP